MVLSVVALQVPVLSLLCDCSVFSFFGFFCYAEIQSGVTDACWGSALFLACAALGLQ